MKDAERVLSMDHRRVNLSGKREPISALTPFMCESVGRVLFMDLRPAGNANRKLRRQPFEGLFFVKPIDRVLSMDPRSVTLSGEREPIAALTTF